MGPKARMAVFAAVSAVLAGSFAFAANSSSKTSESEAAPATPTEQELAGAAAAGGAALDALTSNASGTTGTTVPGVNSSGHGHAPVPDLPLDNATRDQLAAQLVGARAAAMTYPTVADAEAAGYKMVTPYVPLIGAHYIKFDLLDLDFEIDQPEMLLYDGTNEDSRIVGLSYYQLGTTTEPAGFAGPNDHWHQHVGLCLSSSLVVIGAESTTPEECAARGGQKFDGSNAWMVHAWVVPGWDSPQGVFSAENADLT